MAGVVCAAVVLVGVAARLATWDVVFTPRGVRFLVDTDPHYHVLRAERILAGSGADVWFDPSLNHPRGAIVPWPPGFDAAIGGVSRVLYGDSPSRFDIERVAVFFPVVIGIASLLLQMLVANRLFGPLATLMAGVLGALLPIQVRYGALGAVDQHIAEQLGLCVAVLGISFCCSGRRKGPLLIALSVFAGPWIWHGSTVVVAFVLLTATVIFVMRPQGNDAALELVRNVAVGCAAGGTALALSIAAWGPPAQFRSVGLNGLSWIHPISIVAVAIGLVALSRFGRAHPQCSRPQRSIAAMVALAAVSGAVTACAPGAVLHGLRSLRATDAWLRTITEFQPVVFGSFGSFKDDLTYLFWSVGPALGAPLLAIGALRRRWAQAPESRTGLSVLTIGTVVFVGLFLARSRFVIYAAPFIVWWGAIFLADAVSRPSASRYRARAIAAVAAALFLVPSTSLVRPTLEPAFDERLVDLLTWVRARTPNGEGIIASWTLGHMIPYYAGAPAVVTPFGTDVGAAGMACQAAFYYAPTPDRAEQVLSQSRIRYVLFGDFYGELEDAMAFAPHDAVPVLQSTHDYWRGRRTMSRLPAYSSSVPGRLYEHDGAPMSLDDRTGIAFLRLVHEALPPGPWYKLFERIKGARLDIRGAAPRESVAAYVEVVTNAGRRIRWWTTARADENGAASMRVPYATGQNGSSTAGIYIVGSGVRTRNATVPETAVQGGEVITLDLGASASGFSRSAMTPRGLGRGASVP